MHGKLSHFVMLIFASGPFVILYRLFWDLFGIFQNVQFYDSGSALRNSFYFAKSTPAFADRTLDGEIGAEPFPVP